MTNPDSIVSHITSWLIAYASKAGAKGFVLGVSGGVDSALTAHLCALTGLELRLMELPIHQPPSHVQRGKDMMDALCSKHAQVTSRCVDLTDLFDQHLKALNLPSGRLTELALINTRARLRMTTLYAVAQAHGLLVVGTGNKVEDFGIGFYTKYGDGGVDLSPIADLTKSEVQALAGFVGVPAAILTAAPSDGLWDDGRSDEMQIGASYSELEWAMARCEAIGWQAGQPVEPLMAGDDLSERQGEVLAIYCRMHTANQHKMQPIPICVIPNK